MSTDATTTPCWDDLAARMGRNDLPGVLFCNAEDLMADHGPAELRKAIRRSWSAAEWPEQTLSAPWWRQVFRAAQFDLSGIGEQVTLYRGARPERKAGMSWTTDLTTAWWFAHRFTSLGRDATPIWTVTAPVDAVLADLRDGARGEHEIVLDATSLDIQRWKPRARCEPCHWSGQVRDDLDLVLADQTQHDQGFRHEHRAVLSD